MAITMSRLTKEFLFFPVTTTDDLSGVTAEVAFMDTPSALPDVGDWVSADVLLIGGVWNLRVLVGPGGDKDLTPATASSQDYQAWAKIIDVTEVPVRKVGMVTIE